ERSPEARPKAKVPVLTSWFSTKVLPNLTAFFRSPASGQTSLGEELRSPDVPTQLTPNELDGKATSLDKASAIVDPAEAEAHQGAASNGPSAAIASPLDTFPDLGGLPGDDFPELDDAPQRRPGPGSGPPTLSLASRVGGGSFSFGSFTRSFTLRSLGGRRASQLSLSSERDPSPQAGEDALQAGKSLPNTPFSAASPGELLGGLLGSGGSRRISEDQAGLEDSQKRRLPRRPPALQSTKGSPTEALSPPSPSPSAQQVRLRKLLKSRSVGNGRILGGG
ncbi:hypothetical protein T484DRAFT_1908243, partial [Baffinella frigidus]